MNGRRFKRSSDTLFSQVGNDIVALRVSNGRSYGMEEVTAVIWTLLEKPTDLDGICARLVQEYDVHPADCRSDVQRLLELFHSEGLIEEASEEQSEL